MDYATIAFLHDSVLFLVHFRISLGKLAKREFGFLVNSCLRAEHNIPPYAAGF